MKHAYGWLNKSLISSIGGGGGGSSYDYGWPSGGTNEPNVSWQYLFDEGSSPLVDEVGAVSLPEASSPDYGTTASGVWANLSPGCTCKRAGPDYFGPSTTAIPDIGTSDLTMEWVATNDDDTADGYPFEIYKDSSNYIWAYQRPAIATPVIETRMRITGTIKDWSLPVPKAAYADGDLHKFRITFDRDGNEEVLIDGVSYGTASINGAGGNFTGASLYAGRWHASGSYAGTFYEMRCSLNLTNNSGGPGGG